MKSCSVRLPKAAYPSAYAPEGLACITIADKRQIYAFVASLLKGDSHPEIVIQENISFFFFFFAFIAVY